LQTIFSLNQFDLRLKALEQKGFQKFHGLMYYALQLCNFLKQSIKFVPNTH